MRLLLALFTIAFSPLAVLAAPELPANVEHVETFRGVEQYRLKSNGMPILLVPNHAAPVFTFMVVYHVGSRNEAPGNTGSAHLLEHMIFNKSTENFGRAHGHPTFQEVLYAAGADYASTNMTTWYDRMNGYSTLPSDKLELAMKIEADRLGRGLILDSERQLEMSVVRNEYEIGENQPYNVLGKAVIAAAILAHPYHWSTIGYRTDIEGVTTDKLREHYRTFFHPNNAEAILVGDFDPAQALALFDREFGGFKKSEKPIPQVITVEPPQEGERRVTVQRPGTVGLVEIGYVRPGALHPDFPAIDLLAQILGVGVNSRLHQELVEKQLATEVFADNYVLRDPFPLLLVATAAPGKSHAEVEAAIKATVAKVVAEGVTDEELKRAQSQIEVDLIRSRDGAYAYAASLGEAVASADWKWFLTASDRIKAVTAADVKRVAATYLIPEHATVGWFVPLADGAKAVQAAAPAPTAAPVPTAEPAPTPTEPATAPAASAAAGKSFAERTVRRVLPNGLTIDIIENHANPTVSVRGLIFAGEAAATGGRAVPDLTARLLSRGTTTRTKEQIGALLDDAGATRYYTPGRTEVGFGANGMARNLPLLLEILADELQRPAFTADELVKAKAEARTAVLRASDDTGARATERLNQRVFPENHPYRAIGKDATLASLDAATVEDVKAFHQARYNGASVVLAVAGDVNPDAVLALVEKHFGAMTKGTRFLPQAERVEPGPGAREVVTLRGKANMNILIGTASRLRRNDPDFEAAMIANAAFGQSSLSSRLGIRVRDKEGLSYSLGSGYIWTDALDGLWRVNVNVAPQNVAKALKSSLDELAKYVREGATEEEVNTQKNFFAGYFQVGLGTNDGVAGALVVSEKFGFGPGYLDDYPKRFRSVTREQVHAALKQHFLTDRLNIIVGGDLDQFPDETK